MILSCLRTSSLSSKIEHTHTWSRLQKAQLDRAVLEILEVDEGDGGCLAPSEAFLRNGCVMLFYLMSLNARAPNLTITSSGVLLVVVLDKF